jgi:hypothetical protein
MKSDSRTVDPEPKHPARADEGPRWLARAAFLPIALAVGLLAFGAIDPDLLRRLLRKEGPLEHVSHVVLLVAALGFFAGARAHRRPAIALVGAFCTLVLLEEIDWGAVYGWYGMANPFKAVTGSVNVHNRWHGHSYVVFAAPMLGYFALAIPRAPAAIKRRLGSAVPTRQEGLAFALLLTLVIVLAIVLPTWERERDELIETSGYAILLVVSLRAALTRAPRDRA